jgi:hypothetical protein
LSSFRKAVIIEGIQLQASSIRKEVLFNQTSTMKGMKHMKNITQFVIIIVSVFQIACLFSHCHADDSILRVDFNVNTLNEQYGWKQFGWPSGKTPGPASVIYSGLDTKWTSSGTQGEVVLTIAAGNSIESTGGMLTRDRGAPDENSTDFPYSDVYRDFINATENVSLWIKLSGLTPERPYDLVPYVYDHNNSRKMVFVDYTGGSPGIAGTVNYLSGTEFYSDTPTDIYAAMLQLAANEEGDILFRVCSANVGLPGTISGLKLKKGNMNSFFSMGIDFGPHSAPHFGNFQSGFFAFHIPTGDTSGPITNFYGSVNTRGSSGTIAVTLAAGDHDSDTMLMLSRDRGAPVADGGSFSYSDLYRDLAIGKNNNQPFWIGLLGLTPECSYYVTLYSYDNNSSKSMTFTDYTTGFPGASGVVEFTAGSLFEETTDNDVFAKTLKVIADEDGRVLIRGMPSSGNSPALNGLHIEFVPDPGTFISIR